MSSIGFTGTRRGMTELQKQWLRDTLATLAPDSFHHGDCIGADAEAHLIARELEIRVIIHPPSDSRLRAFMQGDEALTPRPYLQRNRTIVHAADGVIGCPAEMCNVVRSGTWSTIRLARRHDKMLAVVLPDGSIQRDESRGGR